MPTIEYPLVRPYVHGKPLIPVRLVDLESRVWSSSTFALLDTGADVSVFHVAFGEELGIDFGSIPAGEGIGLGGQFPLRYYVVGLQVGDRLFKARVAFTDAEWLDYALLGREGFFDNVQVGLRESAGEFYLKLEP
ncbi:MAG: retropepsin-like domain-containing protein [Anaerolineae bacterium]|nr:retropepsin-like domain-containing protein [Anaerolineae bacterium]